MPQITLRVTESILKELQELADSKNLTVTDYILSQSIPEYIDNIVTMDKILEKLSLKSSGDIFSLKSLFPKSTWESFSSGSRISTGRLFFKSYNENKFNLKGKIEYLGKNSANLAIYKML